MLSVNNGDRCYSLISQDNRMVKSKEVAYYAKHKEADTRMIYHERQLPSGTNVVVRTVDTDVFAIALGCFYQLQDKRIWVESGIQSKNNLRYISINQLFHQHAIQHCHSTMPSQGVIPHLCSTEKGSRSSFSEKILNFKKYFLICRTLKVHLMTLNQINHWVLCMSNVWKKEDKLNRSSTSRDLCYQVQTKKKYLLLSTKFKQRSLIQT